MAGRRDAEAFGLFYRRRVDAVLAFFLRRTGDRELAADLTAETFAAALTSLPRYRPERSSALAWLFTIAHHKLVDSLRRGQVEDRARRRLGLEPLSFSDSPRRSDPIPASMSFSQTQADGLPRPLPRPSQPGWPRSYDRGPPLGATPRITMSSASRSVAQRPRLGLRLAGAEP